MFEGTGYSGADVLPGRKDTGEWNRMWIEMLWRAVIPPSDLPSF